VANYLGQHIHHQTYSFPKSVYKSFQIDTLHGPSYKVLGLRLHEQQMVKSLPLLVRLNYNLHTYLYIHFSPLVRHSQSMYAFASLCHHLLLQLMYQNRYQAHYTRVLPLPSRLMTLHPIFPPIPNSFRPWMNHCSWDLLTLHPHDFPHEADQILAQWACEQALVPLTLGTNLLIAFANLAALLSINRVSVSTTRDNYYDNTNRMQRVDRDYPHG